MRHDDRVGVVEMSERSAGVRSPLRPTKQMPDTEGVPVDDVARRVNETLTRADSLFGSASADTSLKPQQLTDAADALRRSAASDTSGLAATGYTTRAQEQASTLAGLATSDTAFNHILQTAASAENTAAAASRSTVASAAEHTGNRAPAADSPGGQRALIAGLHSKVSRQQELVLRHQQQANELAEQVRQVLYD